MEQISLVRPGKEHEAAAAEYLQEHLAAGEPHLHGSSLMERQPSYAAWLAHLEKTSRRETVGSGWVPSSTFFAVRESDGRIVGVIDIRHELNDFLQAYGGHIGYGVRPSERRRGYAREILRLGLEYCRALGLHRVMLACNRDNIASGRTIRAGGGRLEREFLHTDGNVVQVYWIALDPGANPQ